MKTEKYFCRLLCEEVHLLQKKFSIDQSDYTHLNNAVIIGLESNY